MTWPVTYTPGAVLTAAQLTAMMNPPTCQAYLSGSLPIASGATWKLLTLDGEAWDSTGDMHNNTTNPSRVYARGTGKYLLQAVIGWPSNATDNRRLTIMKNSNGDTTLATGVDLGEDRQTPVSGVTTYNRFDAMVALTDGDYIEAFVSQTSGSSLTLNTGARFTALTLTGISA